MNGNSYHSPSAQTVKAIDHCRKEFAETRGTTRNAVDQFMAGNTKDDYPPFREQFKDVCLTKGAEPEAYLDDLQGIFQATRGRKGLSVSDAFLDQLQKANRVIEVCAQALADGELDKAECLALIPLLSKTESAVTALKQSVIDRKNELSGCDVREFAREKVNGRTA